MDTKALEPHLVETLQQAAREVLETMVFMTPDAVEPLAEDAATFDSEIVGLLGFTGTQSGSFVIRTSRKLAATVAAKMLMMEPGELTDFAEIADAFGEVVNMISGNFKNTWVAEGNQMELSVPHVIEHGNVSSHSHVVAGVRSGVRLRFDEGIVDVGVHFER